MSLKNDGEGFALLTRMMNRQQKSSGISSSYHTVGSLHSSLLSRARSISAICWSDESRQYALVKALPAGLELRKAHPGERGSTLGDLRGFCPPPPRAPSCSFSFSRNSRIAGGGCAEQ
jgi:hypothetical protein